LMVTAYALAPLRTDDRQLHSGSAYHELRLDEPRVLSANPSTASTRGGTLIDIELANAPDYAHGVRATPTTLLVPLPRSSVVRW
jgi:hypothetical protein